MRQYGTLIALAVAVIFGIVAVILANQWLQSRTPQQQTVVKEQLPLTKVVIAAKDLDIGSVLGKENLSLADWPKANVPKGAFHQAEELEGRVVVAKVRAGTPLVAAELAAPGSGVGLVASIDPGKRAMSIRVDEVVGVAGFVLPNTFVDIMHVTGKPKRVETVLKNIEVLAIAQQTFVEEGKAKVVRTVTLELDPKQAEKLALKTHTGAIQLALRNPAEDQQKVAKQEPEEKPEPPVVEKTPKKAAKKRVYRPRPPAPKPPPTHDVTVIRGTQSVETVKFAAGD